MEPAQVPVHIARRAADRLAPDLVPQLPLAVSRVLAEADPRGNGTLDEVPAASDSASLVARGALMGWKAISNGAFAAGPPRELDEPRLLRAVEALLRRVTGVPPGMDPMTYDLVLRILSEEIVDARRRL